ncbi:DUF4919 domain-containing protein [Microbulbifer guangxiensis]|uniref:DUF4919 domain-containing protein n=1 Tax=Microbulbifer guangxiensis TaxID=2904249 RepID=UPI001F2885DC|nr:DUF4919 domain-containing protein [Microbulbifer guangxiensis]
MTPIIKPVAIIAMAVLLTACAGAPTGGPESTVADRQPPVPASEYRRLLTEAQTLSFTLDFDALRRAYSESEEYNPHGGIRLTGLPEAYQSVEQSDYERCLRYVDEVLANNYMSLEAHMIGVVCSGRSEAHDREDLHRYMVEGLMDSIERSGDGRTQESAYHTITTSELRAFVRLKGLEVLEQSIVYDQQGVYDKMQVRDPESGSEYPLFFNVSQQFAHSVENESASLE